METFDCSLEIDGITGEGDGSGHPDLIDVVSFGWAESHVAPSQSGLGAGVSRVHVDDLEVVARTSKASPTLMLACASGRHFSNARLTCRLSGEVDAAVLVMSLAKVVVTRYRVAGSAGGGGATATDEIAVNFREITIEFRPGRQDDRDASSVVGGWNVQDNREV